MKRKEHKILLPNILRNNNLRLTAVFPRKSEFSQRKECIKFEEPNKLQQNNTARQTWRGCPICLLDRFWISIFWRGCLLHTELHGLHLLYCNSGIVGGGGSGQYLFWTAAGVMHSHKGQILHLHLFSHLNLGLVIGLIKSTSKEKVCLLTKRTWQLLSLLEMRCNLGNAGCWLQCNCSKEQRNRA